MENTIGMVVVACRATSTSVEDVAKITSTFSRTSSAASSRSLSTTSAQRKSMTMFLALEIAKIAKAGPQCLHPVRGCGSSPET